MNLILISLDSVRADALACYGNPRARTPNLDRLARRGARFQEAITQAPFTIPSHASIFTGLYPHHHRLREQHGQKLDPRAATLFTALRQAGYAVASLMSVQPFGPEHGYADLEVRGPATLESFASLAREFGRREFFIFIHYWEAHVPYHVHLPPRSRDEWLAELALRLEDHLGVTLPAARRDALLPSSGARWIDRVWRVRDLVATRDPRQLRQVYAGYARAVTAADRLVGGVMTLLEQMQLADRTLVAVFGDHGESFNEHGELADKPDYYFHGHDLYDTLLRVPLLLAGPSIPAGRTVAGPVQCIDLAPTVYDYLGAPPLENSLPFDGLSLRRAIEGGAAPRDYSLTEIWRADHNCHQVAYRTSRYKLIADFDTAREQLYDLAADPGETRDLAAALPERVAELKAKLLEVWQPEPAGAEAAMTEAEERQVIARLEALGYI